MDFFTNTNFHKSLVFYIWFYIIEARRLFFYKKGNVTILGLTQL